MSDNTDNPKPKSPTSPRQLAANRANFKKSTGPATQEGKDRARFNSLKHGLTAQEVCIPGESREAFELSLQAYAEIFQPANLLEWDTLDDLVASRWRKRRALRFESAILLERFSTRHADVQKNYETISPAVEVALAFRAQCDESDAFRQLHRYEACMSNDNARALKQMYEFQRNRPPASDTPSTPGDSLRNEAIPNIEHSQTQASEPVMLVVPHGGKSSGLAAPAPEPHVTCAAL